MKVTERIENEKTVNPGFTITRPNGIIPRCEVSLFGAGQNQIELRTHDVGVLRAIAKVLDSAAQALEVAHRQCQWHSGDRLCGAFAESRAENGLVYCALHARLGLEAGIAMKEISR